MLQAAGASVVAVRARRQPSRRLEHEYDGSGRAWLRSPSCRRRGDVPDYRVDGRLRRRGAITVDDPYRFLPTLGEMDLHLVNEGRHELLWTVLGARVHHYDAARRRHRHLVRGVGARARGVRLKGDFNSWDGREHPMRQLGPVGRLGAVRARRRLGHPLQVRRSSAPTAQWREKADPMASGPRCRRATARSVYESSYTGATTRG